MSDRDKFITALNHMVGSVRCDSSAPADTAYLISLFDHARAEGPDEITHAAVALAWATKQHHEGHVEPPGVPRGTYRTDYQEALARFQRLTTGGPCATPRDDGGRG